jgi:hypothetical protein
MKKQTILAILISVSILAIGGWGLFIYSYFFIEDTTNQCLLYDAQNNIAYVKSSVTGIYYIGKDYYCVWAEGRSLEQQEIDDKHEYCHYLIDNDFDHFCTDKEDIQLT